MVDTVKRGAVLLLVAFFLYWALSQPGAFADAVVALTQILRDVLVSIGAAIADIFHALVSRLS